MNEMKKPQSASFTIDGQIFTTDDENKTPIELLALVGFDAAAYDLAQITKGGQVHKFRDYQTVHIKEGDEFVTVRQEAPVA